MAKERRDEALRKDGDDGAGGEGGDKATPGSEGGRHNASLIRGNSDPELFYTESMCGLHATSDYNITRAACFVSCHTMTWNGFLIYYAL